MSVEDERIHREFVREKEAEERELLKKLKGWRETRGREIMTTAAGSSGDTTAAPDLMTEKRFREIWRRFDEYPEKLLKRKNSAAYLSAVPVHDADLCEWEPNGLEGTVHYDRLLAASGFRLVWLIGENDLRCLDLRSSKTYTTVRFVETRSGNGIVIMDSRDRDPTLRLLVTLAAPPNVAPG